MNPLYHHTPERLKEELVWIQRAKESPEHFGPLYEKYHECIFRYIYQRMDDQDLAFDVTSQVFVKAMKNIHRYEFRGVPFSSWLYRIAKSELYQSFRERKSERYVNADSIQLAEVLEEWDEEEMEVNKQKLLKCLRKLKDLDIQLLEMRYFEKRSYREIGEIMEITENNAKVKTFRALERLKQYFNTNAA
ncbi:MAG: sigma-70 family RNA polymerase sigma factor [Bacteroidetes bacterium]|nr:MAG: sigma-70 family RNA polymerase sigma factor [Bacteroidota bacterium]